MPSLPLPMDPGSVGGEAPLSLGDQLHFSVVETWISLSDSQTQLLTSLFSGSMSLSRVLDSRAKSIKMVNDPIALGVGFTGIANVCSCLTKHGTGQAVRMRVVVVVTVFHSLSTAPAPGTKWLLNKYLQRKGCEVAVGTPRRPDGSTCIKPFLSRCTKLRVSKPLEQGAWGISIAMRQVT